MNTTQQVTKISSEIPTYLVYMICCLKVSFTHVFCGIRLYKTIIFSELETQCKADVRKHLAILCALQAPLDARHVNLNQPSYNSSSTLMHNAFPKPKELVKLKED